LQSDFTGSALEEAPGQAIARALGDSKLVILQNHGLLTAGETVESAVFWFMSAEKCCQSQLLADAAARGRGEQTLKVKDKDAQHAFDTVGNEKMGWFSALPIFDDMIRTGGTDYLL
jgi:ribulose-5-phosphate 4-epimerase/fuculose-1-phosphate aldolase